MGVNSLPKSVTRQRRDCDLNPGPSAPESSTLTTRLPSHPLYKLLFFLIPRTDLSLKSAEQYCQIVFLNFILISFFIRGSC